MRHTLIFLFILPAAVSCCSQGVSVDELYGKWLEVLPEDCRYEQGICLETGGRAASIGMATLK